MRTIAFNAVAVALLFLSANALASSSLCSALDNADSSSERDTAAAGAAVGVAAGEYMAPGTGLSVVTGSAGCEIAVPVVETAAKVESAVRNTAKRTESSVRNEAQRVGRKVFGW